MKKKLMMLILILSLLISVNISIAYAESDDEIGLMNWSPGMSEWRIKSKTGLSNRYTSFQTVATHESKVTAPTGFYLGWEGSKYKSNTISGTYPVGTSKISAEVGYSVTWGTSETVQGGFTIPYGYAGRLKLRNVFIDRYRVDQQVFHVVYGWVGNIESCTTEKFGWWDFGHDIWIP